MAKDYAKQKPYQRGYKSKNKRKRSSKSGSLWLLTGLILGLFAAGLFYLHERKLTHPKPTLANTHHKADIKKHTSTKSKSHAVKNEATESEPRFDFYTELPKMKVWVPNGKEHETHTTPKAPPLLDNQNEQINVKNTNATPTTTATSESKEVESSLKQTEDKSTEATTSTTESVKKYVVQIASLENLQQIDQLKAQLSLLGFHVHVTDVKLNNKSMHRIWVGPFSSKEAAAKAQKDLVTENFKGTVINSKE